MAVKPLPKLGRDKTINCSGDVNLKSWVKQECAIFVQTAKKFPTKEIWVLILVYNQPRMSTQPSIPPG